jgi:hypothetical protein
VQLAELGGRDWWHPAEFTDALFLFVGSQAAVAENFERFKKDEPKEMAAAAQPSTATLNMDKHIREEYKAFVEARGTRLRAAELADEARKAAEQNASGSEASSV